MIQTIFKAEPKQKKEAKQYNVTEIATRERQMVKSDRNTATVGSIQLFLYKFIELT